MKITYARLFYVGYVCVGVGTCESVQWCGGTPYFRYFFFALHAASAGSGRMYHNVPQALDLLAVAVQ